MTFLVFSLSSQGCQVVISCRKQRIADRVVAFIGRPQKEFSQSAIGCPWTAWHLAFSREMRTVPKAVTGIVQQMARLEDLESKLEEVSAERDQLALRLAGWEGSGHKKTVEETCVDGLIEPVIRYAFVEFRLWLLLVVEAIDRNGFGAAERRLRSDGMDIPPMSLEMLLSCMEERLLRKDCPLPATLPSRFSASRISELALAGLNTIAAYLVGIGASSTPITFGDPLSPPRWPLRL